MRVLGVPVPALREVAKELAQSHKARRRPGAFDLPRADCRRHDGGRQVAYELSQSGTRRRRRR